MKEAVKMTDETKKTLDNLKETGKKVLASDQINNIKETGKKVFSPRNLKKGAGLLVVLAVIGAGGKYFVHQNKVEAKSRAEAARTTLLQNMAAKNNISLVSTDEVKSAVADALGTDPTQVTFKSVNLVAPSFGKDEKKIDNHKDKHDKDKKENKKEHRSDKNEHKDYKQETREGAAKHSAQDEPNAVTQATPKDSKQAPVAPIAPAPEGQTPEGQAPNGQPAQAPNGQVQMQQTMPVPHKTSPMFYTVKCSKDQVNYEFLVNAQDGKVLRSEVKPAGFGLLPK
jgi:hypothetical protein